LNYENNDNSKVIEVKFDSLIDIFKENRYDKEILTEILENAKNILIFLAIPGKRSI